MEEKRVGMPKRVKVETLPDGLKITWPPMGYYWLAAVPFFLLFVVAFAQPSNREDFGSTFFFILMFVGSAYVIGVGLFNQSVIRVDQHTLIASCGPLPYKPRREFDASMIRQVYVRPEIMRRSRAYEICILDKDGAHVRFWRVSDDQIALYLEQEIERFLGIPDEVVRGEWRPEPYLWG